MGGGQLYTRNKVNYLKRNGWKVCLYTGRSGKLYFDDLKDYKENYIPELNYLPFYFNRKTQRRIIRQIINGCEGAWNQVVIESHKQPMAVWGELLASNINGKHVFFDLDEDFVYFESWYYRFLDFKHNRKELAGINELSLEKMFKEYKKISDEDNYHLLFPCTNTIENVDNPLIETAPNSDICLGSISRLDKDYLIPMMEEIVSFCNQNKGKKITVFVVGDSKEKKFSKKLLDIGKEAENLKIILLGFLSPIPSLLIKKVDVFIGTAGSAVMTAEAGKVTIAVDTITCEPIGVIGINAQSTTYSNGNLKWKKLSEYLSYIFFEKSVKYVESQIKCDQFMGISVNGALDEHMLFLEASEKTKEYYTFDKLGIKYNVLYSLIQTLGIKNSKKIKKLLRK